MDKTFEQMVIELREASYTDAQLARLCGCSRQHIGNIGRGKIKKEVGFNIGKKLTALHEALQ